MLEAVLRRERAILAAGLLAIVVIAWLWVVRLAAGMPMHAAMAMPGMPADTPMSLGWLIMMWAVMMVAMMTPSAAPAILLFAGVVRRRRSQGIAVAPTAVFTLGYLLVWGGFSAAAASAQWVLHRAGLLSPAMASVSPLLGGGLLLVAGIYQWLPAKAACLHHCRSPMAALSRWEEGPWGALRMGVRHGTYCVGCCWALMALLFVAGVMNLLWVATIAVLVFIEKLLPGGVRAGRLAGLALAAWGGWLLAAAVRAG